MTEPSPDTRPLYNLPLTDPLHEHVEVSGYLLVGHGVLLSVCRRGGGQPRLIAALPVLRSQTIEPLT